MRSLLIKLILLNAIVFNCYASESLGSIKMEVLPKIDLKASKAVLEFSLEYQGNKPVKAQTANLLGARVAHSISFKSETIPNDNVEQDKNCGNLEENIYFDEPGIGSRTILPGDVLVQNIDLFQIYYKFKEVLGQCDFVFYWNYKLELLGKIEAPRMGGAIIIPSNLDIFNPAPIRVKLKAK